MEGFEGGGSGLKRLTDNMDMRDDKTSSFRDLFGYFMKDKSLVSLTLLRSCREGDSEESANVKTKLQ